MDNLKNHRDVLVGILAGAAAGAALGYFLAHKKEHETGRQIRNDIWTGVTQVALEKGMEIVSDMMKKYSDRQAERAAHAEPSNA